jgi:hypothetical protein
MLATNEVAHLPDIVPGFEALNRVDRSACSTTVRDLAITSRHVALNIDPDVIITRLGHRAARDRNVRYRVRRFFQLCGRPVLSLPLPHAVRPTIAAGGARYLTDAQRQWLSSLSLDQFPKKYRGRVVMATQLLGVASSASVHAYPLVDVCHRIMAHDNPVRAVSAVAQLFRLVNRCDPITRCIVRRYVTDGGLHLTAEEHRWLAAHPDARSEYTRLKRAMCATNARTVRIQQAAAIMRRLIEWHGAPLWVEHCVANPACFMAATIQTIRSAMDHHPLALAQRGRQTRRTNLARGEPGMDLSLAYSKSAGLLLSVALKQDPGDPVWRDGLQSRRLCREAQHGAVNGSSVGLMPVHDALSLAEMDRALRACAGRIVRPAHAVNRAIPPANASSCCCSAGSGCALGRCAGCD